MPALPFPSLSHPWEFSFPNSSLQLQGGNESQATSGATAPGLSLALIRVPASLPLSLSCPGQNSRRVPLFPLNGAGSSAREKSGRKIHEIFSGCAELTQLFRTLGARSREGHGGGTGHGAFPGREGDPAAHPGGNLPWRLHESFGNSTWKDPIP